MGVRIRTTAPRPIIPPRRREAFSVMGGPVDSEGDGDAVKLLEELFQVQKGLGRALTHGFHSYAGRMHPSMARGAIAALSEKGQRVLDPFCGSGTVLVEAMAAGRSAVGVDASPLAILIAKVRSTVLSDPARQHLVETAHGIAEESAELARKRIRPRIPSWAEGEKARFAPHVALELFGLRELVGKTGDDAVGLALRACFSALLVKFMQAGPQAAPGAESRRLGRGVPSRFFASKAEELALSLEGLERKLPVGTPAPEIFSGDARKLARIPSASVDLIVSSPPYAGVYDYREAHDVRFHWLGLPQEKFEEVQVGARGRVGSASRWNSDRMKWLGEMYRTCRPGAHVLLVVGDGVVDSRREDASVATLQAASDLGFTPLGRASQVRPTRDKRLAAIFEGHARREHLVLFRR